MAAKPQPSGPPPAPAVQRLSLQYTKDGVLRYCSARDLGRVVERALRRIDAPVAQSAGFHPHPRISYLSAAPTGAGSKAEYLELRLTKCCLPKELVASLNQVLPSGLTVVRAAVDQVDLAQRLTASRWQLRWSSAAGLAQAVDQFNALATCSVRRPGRGANPSRTREVRAVVTCLTVADRTADLILLHRIPAVRPDDVTYALSGLSSPALLEPIEITRIDQGFWDGSGVADPLIMPVDVAAVD
ncbi:MAG: TIGR03936 family radical SAM-associated protein [Bifidobacteriaceae bacterium]|jgi:radical SAM-linked protein|nr:TIGR03936 family radical SAM-associated protein [Bifidobacteriaceae bacterium]